MGTFLTIVILAIIAFGTRRYWRPLLQRQLLKADAYKQLAGKRVGVVIQQPNGSNTDLEPLVMKQLRSIGILCVPVPREQARQALTKGSNPYEDSGFPLSDFVIVGTVIETKLPSERRLVHTDGFTHWARTHYPDRINKAGKFDEGLTTTARWYYEEYKRESRNEAWEYAEVDEKVSYKCDYRIVAPKGSAGGFAETVIEGSENRQKHLTQIAKSIISSVVDEHEIDPSNPASLFELRPDRVELDYDPKPTKLLE